MKRTKIFRFIGVIGMTSLVLFQGCSFWPKPLLLKPVSSTKEPVSSTKALRSFAEISGDAPIAFGNKDQIFFSPSKEGNIIKSFKIGSGHLRMFIDLEEWLSDINFKKPKVSDIKFDQSNRILISEKGTGKLLRVTGNARKLEVIADSYDGYRFSNIECLEVGRNDLCFLTSPNSGSLYQCSLDSGQVSILNDQYLQAADILLHPSENKLLVAEPSFNRVVFFDLDDSVKERSPQTLIDFSPRQIKPQGLAFDKRDFLYLSLGSLNQILVYDLNAGKEITTINIAHFAGHLSIHKDYLYIGGGDFLSRLKI